MISRCGSQVVLPRVDVLCRISLHGAALGGKPPCVRGRLCGGLMPAVLITLAHLSVWSTTSFLNSAGVIGIGEAPSSSIRACSLGFFSTVFDRRIELGDHVGRGAFWHRDAVDDIGLIAGHGFGDGRNVREAGGTRLVSATPSARSLPDLTWPIGPGRLSKAECNWPPSTSTSAGAVPRYGTWTMLMPVIDLSSSPDICGEVPTPPDPKLSLPGLALA